MLTRLTPLSIEEQKSLDEDGIDYSIVRGVDDLVTTDRCYFAATGISAGEVLRGVEYHGEYAVTSSIATRGRTGTIRYIQAWHDRKKLSTMSTVRY